MHTVTIALMVDVETDEDAKTWLAGLNTTGLPNDARALWVADVHRQPIASAEEACEAFKTVGWAMGRAIDARKAAA